MRLGDKRCKDFEFCDRCPFDVIQCSTLNGMSITNDITLFEILRKNEDRFGYLYSTIESKLNEEVEE